MIDFKTICKTLRKRADNWERNDPEMANLRLHTNTVGKIVASEIRGIVDVFEEYESEKTKRRPKNDDK